MFAFSGRFDVSFINSEQVQEILVQSQQSRHSQKLWNMFEVSNKDTRVTSFLLLNLNILHLFDCF